MSRMGNKIIVLPAGVSASMANNVITVNGPKGTLTQTIDKVVNVEIAEGKIKVSFTSNDPTANAKQGLYRALIANMAKGVSEGFKKTLIISGVGYKASVSGKKLVLNLGFSHNIDVEIPQDITVACPSVTEITVSGIDKQRVGQFASNIRDLRPVEPYHGYGVHYSDEVIIRKVGKAAGKGKK